MKIIENVNVYYVCEHCKRKMFRKGDMTRHEKSCKSNPDNQDACIYCLHCVKKEVTYTGYHDGLGFETQLKSHAFKCKKLDKLMYPFKAEKYAKKYPKSFESQERMPTQCNDFRFDLNFDS